jgi:hypothetical protein
MPEYYTLPHVSMDYYRADDKDYTHPMLKALRNMLKGLTLNEIIDRFDYIVHIQDSMNRISKRHHYPATSAVFRSFDRLFPAEETYLMKQTIKDCR